jgi:hypothetical protein
MPFELIPKVTKNSKLKVTSKTIPKLFPHSNIVIKNLPSEEKNIIITRRVKITFKDCTRRLNFA